MTNVMFHILSELSAYFLSRFWIFQLYFSQVPSNVHTINISTSSRQISLWLTERSSIYLPGKWKLFSLTSKTLYLSPLDILENSEVFLAYRCLAHQTCSLHNRSSKGRGHCVSVQFLKWYWREKPSWNLIKHVTETPKWWRWRYSSPSRKTY